MKRGKSQTLRKKRSGEGSFWGNRTDQQPTDIVHTPKHVSICRSVSSCRAILSLTWNIRHQHKPAEMNPTTTKWFNLPWISDLHALYNANPYRSSIIRQNSKFRHNQRFHYFFSKHYIFRFRAAHKEHYNLIIKSKNGATCWRHSGFITCPDKCKFALSKGKSPAYVSDLGVFGCVHPVCVTCVSLPSWLTSCLSSVRHLCFVLILLPVCPSVFSICFTGIRWQTVSI